MPEFFAALIVVAAIVWGASRIARELRATRDERVRGRGLAIAGMFAPGIAAAQDDPRALLVWQPLARMVRQLYPIESASPKPFMA